MPISKVCRLAKFVDDMIEDLRSSDRWTRSYPMHSTLAKVDKKLVSYKLVKLLFIIFLFIIILVVIYSSLLFVFLYS